MPARSLFLATLIGAFLAGVPAVRATAPDDKPPPCVFTAYVVTSVTPHYEIDRASKIEVRRMRGAEIYVQAEFGLTAEWLRLQIQRHLAAMKPSSMPDCALDAGTSDVAVESRGAGFLITVRSPDERVANEVLRRARLLHPAP